MSDDHGTNDVPQAWRARAGELARAANALAMPFCSTPSRMGIPFKLWIAFDLQPWLPDMSDADSTWQAATRLALELRRLGVEPLVEEYDANGNYRAWVLPDATTLSEWEGGPYPNQAVAWAESALEKLELPPECLASMMALPGRHHSDDHWSRFWVGGAWVGGAEAVDVLLNWRPIPVAEFKRIVVEGLPQAGR